MKRMFALMLSLLLMFSLAACTSAPPPEDTSEPADPASPTAEPSVPDPAPADTAAEGFPLALITDIGTIDDKSFNQGSWEGLVQYAEEAGIAHKYYQPNPGKCSKYYSRNLISRRIRYSADCSTYQGNHYDNIYDTEYNPLKEVRPSSREKVRYPGMFFSSKITVNISSSHCGRAI